MHVVLIDHQDSFVYNLAQAVARLGPRVTTVRSSVGWNELQRLRPDAIVLSPGPGHPKDRRTMGVTPRVLRQMSPTIPTLGVCLGHQAIGAFFGATVERAPAPCHGETTAIRHLGRGLYQGLPNPFAAARYHSLVVSRRDLPPVLEETSWETGGILMGLRHHTLPIEGVQFHPESYLTRAGSRLLQNFLREARR